MQPLFKDLYRNSSRKSTPKRIRLEIQEPQSEQKSALWMEQCDAAEGIRVRYGLEAAFDYAIGEKLLQFAEAAGRHPEFARELPRFVSRVRSMFTAEEIGRTLRASSASAVRLS